MPYRKVPLITEEIYHVFNRGVARMPIFNNARDYTRFLQTLSYYTSGDIKQKFSSATVSDILEAKSDNKTIEIIAYCFMPNHFHLLLKQKADNGISLFMKNVGISYTRYLNTKYERVGPLFQGQFKAVHIETTQQLLHVSRYIHLNPSVGFIVKRLEDYSWSSFHEYTGLRTGVCVTKEVLDNFKSRDAYKQFVLDQEDFAKKLAILKHLFVDFEE